MWTNITNILAAAGMEAKDLVKITNYFTTLAHFKDYSRSAPPSRRGTPRLDRPGDQRPGAPGADARSRGGSGEGMKLARTALLASLALSGALTIAPAFGQAFPSKSLRLIVPFPPGGSADILARTIAAKMAEGLAQQVIADNRPGAGTAIGAEATAKSAPDGYTIMIGTVSSHAINPSLNREARL